MAAPKETTEGSVEERCAQCSSKSSSLRRCTRCLEVRYCSSQCQRQHWPIHKSTCRRPKPTDDTQANFATAKRCACCESSDSNLRRCTGCLAVWYCSKTCQTQHWSQHKPSCRETGSAGAKDTKRPDTKTPDAADSSENTTRTRQDEEPKPRYQSVTYVCRTCGKRSPGVGRCKRCSQHSQLMRATFAPISKDLPFHEVYLDTSGSTFNISNDVAGGPLRDPLDGSGRALAAKRASDARKLAASQRGSSTKPVHVDGTPILTWQEARSRATILYPGKRIVDKFKDLDNDLSGVPAARDVVAVSRITGGYPHNFHQARSLEDAEGKPSYVLFYVLEDPMPFFRYDQLRPGTFFCMDRGFLHHFADKTVGFRVDHPSDVLLLEA
ncbi:hypothetical protein BaRGS_00024876 [Batillaria attramentaria]|uniref:MYND-type domain-containing protein n=1 Tax=Batillaria attramentaria TaxID=370345 RepID=A0ABD0K9W4_9CAEN